MRSVKFVSMILLACAVLSVSAPQSQACDRFHLPGRPVERAVNLVSVVRPVQRTAAAVGAVVKAKPVRSTLKFLFF